ncbi:MAG TPA: type VI secretion system protein TssL, long form [Burkholderia sp.]|nr:type VI secretion system protein TssL, long form [Burkholderia sp.]
MSQPAETHMETPIRPGEDDETRLAAVRATQNPLLEAAHVLLRAQADMPDALEPAEVRRFHALLAQEVRVFEQLCTQANIRRDHMTGASYCLCTALDEAAMQAGWAKDRMLASEWVQRSLSATFHRDVTGGEKVYLLIGRLMAEPDEHRDLLQVIYRALSLGFEGRYRGRRDGPRQHTAIRQRLYTEIMRGRPPVPTTLSPNARSPFEGVKPRRSFFEFPVWMTVAVLSVVLLGMYGWFKYNLDSRSAAIQRQLVEIQHMTPLPATPALHLKALLKDEIAAGTVAVVEDARHSAVTFRGDAMFAPGGVAVNAGMAPLIAKLAGEIAKVPGKVTVFGYTDNVPIRSRQFASNTALSEERATQIMQMLQADGVPASRLEAIGKGEADPIGDNRTAPGRAQNRRVEISVVPS